MQILIHEPLQLRIPSPADQFAAGLTLLGKNIIGHLDDTRAESYISDWHLICRDLRHSGGSCGASGPRHWTSSCVEHATSVQGLPSGEQTFVHVLSVHEPKTAAGTTNTRYEERSFGGQSPSEQSRT